MKLFMYHYVREDDHNNSYSRHKNINDFKKECEVIKKENTFLCINQISEKNVSKNNFIAFTFDDGLKDHLKAAEIMHSLGITATFYIPIYPYLNKDILDVHKAHLICSKVGPYCLELLNKTCEEMGIDLNKLEVNLDKQKFINKYSQQIDNIEIKEFKRIINYYGDIGLRTKILDSILSNLNVAIEPNTFYLSLEEIIFIDSLGFEIGSHGVSHTLLSRLDIKKQNDEILQSKLFLENLLNKKIDSFCYPYGTKNSYDQTTLDLLKENRFKNAVSVESRDFLINDFINNIYEIPRYDCNEISKFFN